MVEQSISLKQKKGLIKMHSILVNMVQDHKIDDLYVIGGKECTLTQVSSRIKEYTNKTTYTINEKQYLNEVRNLVLAYQDGTLKTSLDNDSLYPVSTWGKKISWVDNITPSNGWDDELTWAM